MKDAIERMIRKFSRSEPTNGTPPVSSTPYRLVKRAGDWHLVTIDADMKGVRVVDLPDDLAIRYWDARLEWTKIQGLLGSLDYTHRKRKSRKRPTLEGIAARDVSGEPTEP